MRELFLPIGLSGAVCFTGPIQRLLTALLEGCAEMRNAISIRWQQFSNALELFSAPEHLKLTISNLSDKYYNLYSLEKIACLNAQLYLIMAEIVSLTAGIISLAALFNTCIECFDCYRLARDCPAQVKTKLVRLDFEKERLLIWAEQAGLMRTDAAFRNPNIEANEGNLRDTLEQIRMLLADSTKLQDKYGIRQQEGLATLTERKVEPISRNSFEIFRASYRRFCGRFIVSQTGLKLTARVRWAILDENKFEGLIKTLRDFVDNLYWYVKVERRVQDRMVEQDIMAVTDTVDLLMIKEASEDDYQIWSDIASRAVDRAERSTITHTETDEQSASEEDEVAPGSPTRPTRSGAVGAIFESSGSIDR